MPVVRLAGTAFILAASITILALVRVSAGGDVLTADALVLPAVFGVLWLVTLASLIGIELVRSPLAQPDDPSPDRRRTRQIDLRLLIGLLTGTALAIQLVAAYLTTGLDGWHAILLLSLGGGLGLFVAGVAELTLKRRPG